MYAVVANAGLARFGYSYADNDFWTLVGLIAEVKKAASQLQQRADALVRCAVGMVPDAYLS